jgi:hypothetical protein
MQDQQRQLNKLQDEQQQLELRQQDSIMYDHVDRLRLYSAPIKAAAEPTTKKKPKR